MKKDLQLAFIITLGFSMILYLVYDIGYHIKDRKEKSNNSIVQLRQQCSQPDSYSKYLYCINEYTNLEVVKELTDLQTEAGDYAAAHPDEVTEYRERFIEEHKVPEPEL